MITILSWLFGKNNLMKNKKVITIIIIGIILVAFILVFKKHSSVTDNAQNNKYNIFAKCITDSGAKLYCADWAPACIEQKKAFGEDAELLTYIECSLPDSKNRNAQCKKDSIETYPTWEFADGRRIEDYLSFERLGQETNCKAPVVNNLE